MKKHFCIAYTTLLALLVSLGNSVAQTKSVLNRDEVALVKESLKGLPENQYHVKLIESDGKGGAIEKTYGKMDWKTIEAGKAASGILFSPYIKFDKIRFQKLQIIGPGCFDIILLKNFQEVIARTKSLDRVIARHQ